MPVAPKGTAFTGLPPVDGSSPYDAGTSIVNTEAMSNDKSTLPLVKLKLVADP
jgi:hypothetical protein